KGVWDRARLPVPAVVRDWLGQRGDIAEVGQLGFERPQFGLEAQVPATAGAVVVGGLAGDAALGHGPQQRQDRRHPGPAAHADQVGRLPPPPPTKIRSAASPSRSVNMPYGPLMLSRSPTCNVVSRKWENSPSG